jgi:hypothetical protein
MRLSGCEHEHADGRGQVLSASAGIDLTDERLHGAPPAAAIPRSASQNGSSSDTLVEWPAITTERLTMPLITRALSSPGRLVECAMMGE